LTVTTECWPPTLHREHGVDGAGVAFRVDRHVADRELAPVVVGDRRLALPSATLALSVVQVDHE